ncbi:MAG: MFS transporter [Flavisolibacter sp.]
MKINIFRALNSRNYRLYFLGQTISLTGTWMQRTAVSWVVYSLTHSTFMLGLTFFAGQFPSFLFSLLGGVVSDRYNRLKVLLTTQIASSIQAAILAGLVIFHHAAVWEILALSTILGIINAFDVPARQSLIYEMVGRKEDLSNALALNSSMVNLARLVGPAVAGIVLEKYGEGFCFLLNAASFLAVIICLLIMKLPKYQNRHPKKNALGDLKEGLLYLKRTPSIAGVVFMLSLISLWVLPFNTLLPVFAKEVFKGNATTFGYLNSFIGLGAIAGAFFLASLKPGADLRRILFISTVILGISLLLFSHQSNFYWAMPFVTATGFGLMAQTTITNTLIQTNSDPAMRGRMISYFALAFFGMQPFGSLIIGVLSGYIGAPNTVLVEGFGALLTAAIFRAHLKKTQNIQTTKEAGAVGHPFNK